MKKIFLLAATAFAMPVVAAAQVAPTGPAAVPAQVSNAPMGMASLSAQDTHFIKVAAISGMSEVNDGKLASTMGDMTVKKLGTQMVADHTAANQQLMSIAQQKGVTPPMQVDPKHAAIHSELTMLQGASFDRKYLSTELKGHEMTIAAFKTEINTGTDADLKTFASSTLPILEQHLAMIKMAMK